MKYIKQFDKLINTNFKDAEIGDYVLCSEESTISDHDDDINIFIENNIGKIIELKRGYDYIVEYDNIPKEFKNEFIYSNNSARGMFKNEVKHISKNKKDLEAILMSKKYNL